MNAGAKKQRILLALYRVAGQTVFLVLCWLAVVAGVVLLGFGRWEIGLLLLLLALPLLVLAYVFRSSRGSDALDRQLEGMSLGMAANMIDALEVKDNATAQHSAVVAQCSYDIAKALGLPARESNLVNLAGLLHDLGKIAVPNQILWQDPTTLSVEERALLEGHTQAGGKILGNVTGFQLLAHVASQHHEHWDGSGYPAGLKGEDIIFEARIVAVAEAAVEMSTTTPYLRPGLGPDEVAARLQAGRGTLYDPVVVDAYLGLVRDGSEAP